MPRQHRWFMPPGARLVVMLLLFVSGIGGAVVWLACQAGLAAKAGAGGSQPASEAKVYAAYAGSASCEECHAAEYAAWRNSHHGLAERLPDARLDGPAFIPERTFHHGTQQTTVLTNNGRYELVTAGLQGSNETFVAERILGESPLRQALVPFPGGRLQAAEAAWDPRSNQWFNVYGNEDRQPGEWGQWLGRGMNWNSMCASCHNTGLHKNYDATTDTYHTRQAEHGVGCEACHGPMRDHNDWQKAHPGKGLKDPTLRKFTRDQVRDTCAACHSRRAELTGDSRPGDSYWDHYSLSIVDGSELFYPDGQIHDEDYEFTAFLGSAMHNKGVRCVDCHDVHTMKTRLPGNQLCLTCHAVGLKNAPNIDPVRHSHHPVYGYDTNGVLVNASLTKYQPTADQAGGECVNCHMPQTAYMQRHWRHDHGFTIPDPLLTREFGIPNACERCHASKGTDWNLKYVEQWYGTNMNRPYRQRAEIVARARQGDDAARGPLLGMLATNDIPYWRAVAAGLLGNWPADRKVTPALLQALDDHDAMVRSTSIRSLAALVEDPAVAEAIQSRLTDPVLDVRIAAAWALRASLATNSPAGADLRRFLDLNADQPTGQLQIGAYELARGKATNALPHFETAVQWDPYSPGIRHELAMVYSRLGRAGAAVTQLEAAVKLAPRDAEFHFKLALALNDTGETARMVTELEQAVSCDPRHARAWYNLGLARSANGDAAGALEALVRSESADPADPRVPYARATVLARLGRMPEARLAVRRSLELAPDFAPALALQQQLQ